MASSLPQKILALLSQMDGLTDREITDRLFGKGKAQQPVNNAARRLAKGGRLTRKRREDGLIGNYLNPAAHPDHEPPERPLAYTADDLSEDRLKHHLCDWLRSRGWQTRVAWARERGIDIMATRGDEKWIVEVKGIGSRPEMRVNYFIGILGEILQRMTDPKARYSIALPDVPQFHRLWERLPALAKQRTQISALFVAADGKVTERN